MGSDLAMVGHPALEFSSGRSDFDNFYYSCSRHRLQLLADWLQPPTA